MRPLVLSVFSNEFFPLTGQRKEDMRGHHDQ